MDKFVTRKRKSDEESSKIDDLKRRKATDVGLNKLTAEKLDCDYGLIYSRDEAEKLLKLCEDEISYFTGQLSKVFVFGKWHDIPRKQAAFGDVGLTYKYSNNVVPALPWTPLLRQIKEDVEAASGHRFNFVLINRYADGRDHMGEHKDDEEELVRGSPIASLSLGQARDFVFRHQDARAGAKAKKATSAASPPTPPPPVKLKLESGSLLLMNSPTNEFWYHSLPKRSVATAPGVRINMTFRNVIHVKR